MPGSKVATSEKGADRGKVLRDTLDMVPIQATILDRDGRVLFANRALTSILGLTPGELIFDRLAPSCIQDVLSALRGMKARGATVVSATMNKKSGGGKVSLHLSGTGPGQDGSVLCLMVPTSSFPDGDHIKALVDAMDVPAQVIGPDMSVTYANERFREELPWVGERKGPQKRLNERRKEFIKDRMGSGTGREIEYIVTERGRSTRYISIATPLEGEGQKRSMLEIWLDVTGAGPVPQSGPEKDELYDEMLDTSNAVVIGLDREGVVQLFNKGAQRALGYTKEAVMGTSWFDYMADPGTGGGALDVFKWNINTGFRTRFENRIRSSSGDPVTISWENTVIFDGRGGIKTILMIGQDITQMKQLEESLILRSEELGRALEEAGIYNDLMLHDIHNSTAAIMGYLELMGLKGLSAEKRREYGSRALSEVKKSASIVKEVRMLSRIDAASEPHPIRLGSTLSKLSEKVKAITGGKCALQLEVKDLSVWADEHLEEAMLKIVEQMMKLMPEPPVKVQVQVRRAPSFSGRATEPVLLTMTAPGLSIGKDQAEALFKSVPRKGELSDRLGMYLVRRVVERYGGAFWVDDDASVGCSRFNILLRESI
jgi:PAS domain S-box-containing protein